MATKIVDGSYTRAQREQFGANVRLARQRAGLTLADVGAAVGLDQSRLSALEHGKIWVGSLSRLVQIAAAVRVPVGELFAGIE